MKLFSLLLCSTLLPAAPTRNIIIDTDAGSDDLIAISFLLSRPEIRIEAITVVNGIAHVPAGARNVIRLLDYAGHAEIPVYEGRATPLEGSSEFPDSWRVTADALPGITLPVSTRNPEPASAFSFLRDRLANPQKPVSVLALGPLTNIAEVLRAAPKSALAIDDLVIMGGAVRVEGNLPAGGIHYSENRTAEWNIYLDPAAAQTVLDAVARCRLVPLDASNSVPLDTAFARQFEKTARSKLGTFTAQVLNSNRTLIDQKLFFAWDPLAAVALTNPPVLKISSLALSVVQTGPDAGRTLESPTARPVRAALSANPTLFQKLFFDTLR